MVFGLWQVQVKDVLIQSRLHKMRRIWAYNEILSWWSKFGKRLQVRTAMEEDMLLRVHNYTWALFAVDASCVMVELCRWLRYF
ncbi:hypothetical protein PIB30_009266 [Stylosanthes scabra]|uniref:Uncharacterized protein n=1 Tax=Stylosanthes scabra TaxID=79078 RepID=A0ABU6R6S6_9FABA|nr:hypothetical protein [Stylosanthes scabra]